MKEFLNENKIWVKIAAICTLIYLLIFKVITQLTTLTIFSLLINPEIISNWHIRILNMELGLPDIIAAIILIPLEISLIVLIIKAIQKLIKW